MWSRRSLLASGVLTALLGAAPSSSATAVPTPPLPTSVARTTATRPLLGTPPAPGVNGVLYVVIPHPDDEFEAWSQVQDTRDLFKVFVLLTHGEQTNNCDPGAPGFDLGIDEPPTPTPQGRWTPSCEEARLSSWRGFLSDMAARDPSLPGTFTDRGVVTRLAGRSAPICRRDAQPTGCTVRDRTARVWTDDGGMGALVVFDLGDRDLTRAEVVWAMQVVRDNRSRLGIDPSLPSRGVVGSYASSLHGEGFHYEHPDHVAVAEALWGTDLHLGPQLGATASDDPRAVVTGVVSEQAMLTAFGPENSFGAHANRYGWLWRDDDDPILHRRVDSYQVDRTGQRRLFHRTQHFWRAFGPPR